MGHHEMGCAKRSGFISCVFLRAAISIWIFEIWTRVGAGVGVDWKPVVAAYVKCEMLNVGTVLIFTQHSVKLEINNVSFHSQMTSPLSLSLSVYASVCACGRKGGKGTGRGGFRCRWANQFWLQLLLHSAVNVCRWQTKLKCPVRLVLPSIVAFHLSVLCSNCVCVCVCVLQLMTNLPSPQSSCSSHPARPTLVREIAASSCRNSRFSDFGNSIAFISRLR